MAIGVHPWNVSLVALADSLALLAFHLESNPRLRVGEIGLDKSSRHKSTFALQKQWFREQWKLALAWNRSVSVHCVRAHGTLVDVASELGLPSGGVFLHSFSGSQDVASALLRMPGEMYFGVSSRINLAHVAQLVVPRSRIVMESDLLEDDPTRPEALQSAAQAVGMSVDEANSNLQRFLTLMGHYRYRESSRA